MFTSLLPYNVPRLAHFYNRHCRYIRWFLRCTFFLVFGLSVIGCGSSQRIQNLELERDELKGQLIEANSQITILREKNAALEADLKGGRTAEEESKALDVREAGLNQLAQDLLTRKSDLDKRESELRLREVDVEEKLDAARKEATTLANRWLMALVALVVLIPLMLAGMFLWLRTTRHASGHSTPSFHPLTPQQAYMLEVLYNSSNEDSELKRRVPLENNEPS